IFLHDMPEDEPFESEQRAFSSGCVRLGQPMEMGKFILSDNKEITPAEFEEKFLLAEKGGEVTTKIYKLEKEMPVYIAYMTAWIDEEGDIHFEDDIYGRDAVLEKALGKY